MTAVMPCAGLVDDPSRFRIDRRGGFASVGKMEIMEKWNRKRVATWATTISLGIWLPVALAQNYFRYNAYILPLCGLVLALLCISLALTGSAASETLHNLHHGFGATKPLEYLLLISLGGGIVIVLLGSGEWYAIRKSQQHVADLRKSDSARPPSTAAPIPEAIAPVASISAEPADADQPPRARKEIGVSTERSKPSGTPPTVGAVTQGPCSIAQIGGSNNQASGGTCAPPDRAFTDEQRSKFVAALSDKPTFSVEFESPAGEPARYGRQIAAALVGWPVDTASLGITELSLDRAIAIQLEAGTVVIGFGNIANARVLRDALRASGVKPVPAIIGMRGIAENGVSIFIPRLEPF